MTVGLHVPARCLCLAYLLTSCCEVQKSTPCCAYSLQVAYLSFTSWNDSRIEAEDRKKAGGLSPVARYGTRWLVRPGHRLVFKGSCVGVACREDLRLPSGGASEDQGGGRILPERKEGEGTLVPCPFWD